MRKTKQHFRVSAESFGELWCKLMHDAPMWPFSASYRCRTCGRKYLISWTQIPSPTQMAVERGGQMAESRA